MIAYIKLRALALSDRWDDGMRLTLMPLRRAVHKLAAWSGRQAHPLRRALAQHPDPTVFQSIGL